MKTRLIAGIVGVMLASGSAQAISLNGQVGKHYSNVGVGMGTETSGLALSGDWTNSDHDGNVGSLGLGFNLPVGPFMATVGGKALYLNPKSNDDGFGVAVGGGLQWSVFDSLSVFGEYYYSPDSLSSGIDHYEQVSAGARYTLFRPLSVEAGYRYVNLSGKDGHRDNALADGPYVGASLSF